MARKAAASLPLTSICCSPAWAASVFFGIAQAQADVAGGQPAAAGMVDDGDTGAEELGGDEVLHGNTPS